MEEKKGAASSYLQDVTLLEEELVQDREDSQEIQQAKSIVRCGHEGKWKSHCLGKIEDFE